MMLYIFLCYRIATAGRAPFLYLPLPLPSPYFHPRPFPFFWQHGAPQGLTALINGTCNLGLWGAAFARAALLGAIPN